MSKKKIATMDDLSQLLNKHNPNFEWKITWGNPVELTNLQKTTLENELLSLLQELKGSLNSFLFSINSNNKFVSLTITNAREEEFLVKDCNIWFDSMIKGKTCDFCDHRLECLTLDVGICVDNLAADQKVKKEMIERFDLDYDKEKAEKILIKHGFNKHSFFDSLLPEGYEIETSSYKNGSKMVYLN